MQPIVPPGTRREISTPSSGETFLLGNTFPERQLILGCSARLLVLIGGGPGSVREANTMLSWGGLVLPLGATRGAAGAMAFEEAPEAASARVDIEQAKRRAVASEVVDDREWVSVSSGTVSEAIGVVGRVIERISTGADPAAKSGGADQ